MTEAERIEIILACQELMTRYAHHIDHREFDDYCSLFTEEMHLEMPGQKPTTSRETLRKGLDHRPVALESRHVITNMRVIPTSDVTATGLCYLSLYRRIRKGDEADDSWALERPAMIGEYHDDYVKSDEGWRIQKRVLKPVFTSRNMESA